MLANLVREVKRVETPMRDLLGRLRKLEAIRDLPNDPVVVLDEDLPSLSPTAFDLVDDIYRVMDDVLVDRAIGGIDQLKLDRLAEYGFPSTWLPLGRAYIHTQKGKLLVIIPQ